MISVQKISKSFGDITVLRDISLAVGGGERVSLVGPGGCGKSTILKLILGITPPDNGAIELCGQDMVGGSDSEKEAVLKRVGMAFQQGALFDFMTVGENINFAMEHMTDFSKDEIDQKVRNVLDGVKLGRTLNMYPHELSGGMKRRVGIARALATEPIVSIFDEPTSGLDPVTSTIILNMISDLAGLDENSASVIATTSIEIAIRFAERIIVVNEGVVAADGPWRELLVDGPEWVRHFLGTRLIGLDLDYAVELGLPQRFVDMHWS